MARRKNQNTVVKFLQNIVDDSKELVDDLLDRAASLEDDVRDTVRQDDEDHSPREYEKLSKAINELSTKVEELATAGSKSTSRSSS